MSAFPRAPEPDEEGAPRNAPDHRDLDAAIRAVLATTLNAPKPELDETIEVVNRAATTIDELVERNRAITEAAVRSVEHYRLQVKEARTEAEELRAELRRLQDENSSMLAAARAQAAELEVELAARTRDLDFANGWIAQFRDHVGQALGDAAARLEQSRAEGFLDE